MNYIPLYTRLNYEMTPKCGLIIRNIAKSCMRTYIYVMSIPPGVIWGCFRRVSATQITRTPTHKTTMVAPTGTIISRSSQAGSHGIRFPDLSLELVFGIVPSELLGPNSDPPIRSKISKK